MVSRSAGLHMFFWKMHFSPSVVIFMQADSDNPGVEHGRLARIPASAVVQRDYMPSEPLCNLVALV